MSLTVILADPIVVVVGLALTAQVRRHFGTPRSQISHHAAEVFLADPCPVYVDDSITLGRSCGSLTIRGWSCKAEA